MATELGCLERKQPDQAELTGTRPLEMTRDFYEQSNADAPLCPEIDSLLYGSNRADDRQTPAVFTRSKAIELLPTLDDDFDGYASHHITKRRMHRLLGSILDG